MRKVLPGSPAGGPTSPIEIFNDCKSKNPNG